MITPDPSMGFQARNGDLYSVTTPPGTLTVGTPPPGIVPTQVPTGGVPSPGIPTVIPTTDGMGADGGSSDGNPDT